MEQQDDLLGLLESDEKPFKEEDKEITKSKPKITRPNLWDKLDFKPRKLELSNMSKEGNSFVWYSYLTDGSIPDEIVNKVKALVKALGGKKFVLRTIGDKTDKLGIELLNITECAHEVYLPWRKFNEEITEPKLSYPKAEGYEVAKAYMKNFDKAPAAVRAINAAYSHSLVGEKCDNQVNFVLCYTDGGAEGFSKTFDYKKEGRLGYYIAMCNELNIPIFNIKNNDSFKRLVKILS